MLTSSGLYSYLLWLSVIILQTHVLIALFVPRLKGLSDQIWLFIKAVIWSFTYFSSKSLIHICNQRVQKLSFVERYTELAEGQVKQFIYSPGKLPKNNALFSSTNSSTPPVGPATCILTRMLVRFWLQFPLSTM